MSERERWPEAEVELYASDGWPIGGLLRAPAEVAARPVPAVVLVPGAKHERDAYGQVPDVLEAAGLATLRIDVRGRGASAGGVAHALMPPLQRRQVALDVAAAVDHLEAVPGVLGHRLGVVAEQDTAAAAVEAVAGDARVRAVVLLSARYGDRLAAALGPRPIAVFGLVSDEDRAGLRATMAAYLASAEGVSRFEVFRGLGFGATMFSSRQFEHPDAEPLEVMIAAWLVERLGTGPERHG